LPQLLSRDELDGRSNAAKAFDRLARAIESDLGGRDQLSMIARTLIEAYVGAAADDTVFDFGGPPLRRGPEYATGRNHDGSPSRGPVHGFSAALAGTAGLGVSVTMSYHSRAFNRANELGVEKKIGA
jgi:hypothetical protein